MKEVCRKFKTVDAKKILFGRKIYLSVKHSMVKKKSDRFHLLENLSVLKYSLLQGKISPITFCCTNLYPSMLKSKPSKNCNHAGSKRKNHEKSSIVFQQYKKKYQRHFSFCKKSLCPTRPFPENGYPRGGQRHWPPRVCMLSYSDITPIVCSYLLLASPISARIAGD